MIKMSINWFLSVCILFCNFHIADAQPVIAWQNTIGSSSDDECHDIDQTQDGGYILAGYSRGDSSGDKTENTLGVWDYWLVKTDSQGNIEWEKTIGSDGEDYCHSVRQTTDRGYILGGYSNGDISGDKTEDNIGDYDYWIVKTDSTGYVEWDNTIGSNDEDISHFIEHTADGGYIIAGYSEGNISGDKTGNNTAGQDFWIVKLNSSGTIEWDKTIGSAGDDKCYTAKPTKDGGYILGGQSNGDISGDKTGDSFGLSDYWVVKISSNGNIQWENTIGSDGGETCFSAFQTSDEGYIIGGHSGGSISGDKTENSIGFNDFWIVKTDSAGAVQWDNTIGSSGMDYLYTLQPTADEGFIMGGFSMGNISGDKTENSINGSFDYWIVKTNSAGMVEWDNTIGSDDIDWCTSLLQSVDGAYVFTGYSRGNISADKTENSMGNYDYWIMKTGAELIADFFASNVCLGDTVCFENLSTSPDSIISWHWNFGDDSASAEKKPCHLYQSPGYYNVTLSIQTMSQADTIVKNVEVYENLTAEAGMDVTIACTQRACLNASASGGTLPYDFQWESGPADRNYDSVSAGLYKVTVTDANGCRDDDTVWVNYVNNDLTLYITADDSSICMGDTTVLNAHTSGSAPPFSYQWNTGLPSNAGPHSISPANTATYQATVIDTAGCQVTAQKIIYVNMLPTVRMDYDTVFIYRGNTFQLCTDYNTNYNYYWHPEDGSLSNTQIYNPIAAPVENIEYTVLVTDTLSGCKDSTSVVMLIKEPPVVIYNTITTNGDGVNDHWQIDNIERYPGSRVEVYNRTGNLVFSANNYRNDWKGDFESGLLPAGSYYYIIEIESIQMFVQGCLTIMY